MQILFSLKKTFLRLSFIALVFTAFPAAKPADVVESPQLLTPLNTEVMTARPVRQESYLSPNSLFLIHYDTTGTHTVPQNYTFDPEIPDYVYSVARYLEDCYYVLSDSLGFGTPPLDDPLAPEIDVYFVDYYNYYGQTFLEQQVEPGVWTSYMTLNSDLENTSVFYTTGLEGLMVTCAHELFHVFQLGYKYRSSDLFYFEMSSVWFEEYMYPEVNDYHSYFNEYARRWNYAINHNNLLYNNVGFNLYIDKRYSNPGDNIIKAVWEQMVTKTSIEAIQTVLTSRGSSFEHALNNWGTAQVLCDPYSIHDFTYPFDDAQELSTISFEEYPGYVLTSINGEISLSSFPITSYYKIQNIPNELLLFEASLSDNTSANIICLNGSQSRVYTIGNGPIVINGNQYSDYIISIGSNRSEASGTYSFTVIESDIISSLYPNPLSSGQTLKMNYILTQHYTNGNLFVYDLNGKKIFSRALKTEELSAELHELTLDMFLPSISSGLYIIVLQADDILLSKKVTFFK